MDIGKQVEALLGSPKFRQFATEMCRQSGVPIPAGEDPSAVMLLRIYQAAPQHFDAFVGQASGIHEAQVAFGSTMKPNAEQQSVRARFVKELPEAQVRAAWKALPEKIRAGNNEQFEQFAKAGLAKAGLSPYAGLTAGQSVIAYFTALDESPSHRSDSVYDDLAAATGGAFGDANELRAAAGFLRETRTREKGTQVNDEVTTRVIEKQRSHEAQIAKANGRSTPSTKPPAPEHDPTRPHGGSTRRSIADAFADQDARAAKPAPKPQKRGPHVVANDKKRLYGEMAYREAAGESTDGLEMGPDLRKETTTELRKQGYDFAQPRGGRTEGGNEG